MANRHFKYGGSTIERVELCPGSVKAIQALGERSAGPAAERGTRIHARLEQLMANPKSKTALSKDEEAVAQAALPVLLQLAAEHGFTPEDLQIEQQLTLHEVHDDAGGTPDIFAFKAFGDLFVPDLKTGRNFVSAEENLQLIFYGCCVMQSLDVFTRSTINNAHFIIIQPEQQPPYQVHVRKWSIPAAKLADYQQRFSAAILRAEAEPDKRIAGEHCEGKYCDARTTCPAYQAFLNERSAGAMFLAVAGEQPKAGRGAELAAQLKAVPLLKAFCKAVEDDAKQELLTAPGSIPGWSLADSYGNRAWKDDKAVLAKAKELKLKPEEYNPRSLISPAAFERLLKTKQLDVAVMSELVERPYSGVKLAESKEADLAEKFAAAI